MRRRRLGNGNDGWDEQGGYMNAKIRKLEAQFAGASQKTPIFSGVRVYVNGYTEPPALELQRLVQENGGTFVQYYSQSSGDFMIASNLPLSKLKKLGNRKVVKATWITESISAGRLLPWKDFELYPSEEQLNLPNNLPVVEKQVTDATVFVEESAGKVTSSDESSKVMFGPSTEASEDELTKRDVVFSESNSPSFGSSIFGESSLTSSQQGPTSQIALRFSSDDQTAPDAGVVTSTVSDDYIRQYYSRSRLHHLSKWAADLRDLVRSMRLRMLNEDEEHGVQLLRTEIENLRAAGEPTEMVLKSVEVSTMDTLLPPRLLMHIDIDCFFVSVCLISRPDLIGHPVAVTHSRGKKTESSLSEVASCSYEARKFGVTNGMHLGDARKLCPNLKTVPYDFDAFYRVAEDLYKTVAKFCLQIEAVSCDEMYVDVTELLEVRREKAEVHLTSPLVLGALLRRHVYESTQCTATCGFGTNRLLARLATKRAKPDSQALLLGPPWRLLPSTPRKVHGIYDLVTPEGRKYLEDLPLSQLPGVGRNMVSRITEAYGVSTCGQLRKSVTPTQLSSLLGRKTSQRILQLCQGNDSSQLLLDRYPKSISAEVNYGVRLSSWSEVEKFVGNLSEELSSRLGKAAAKSRSGFGLVGKGLVVHLLTRKSDQPVESAKFLGHGICDNVTRSLLLPEATAEPKVIASTCLSILRRLAPNPTDIRGLGIQMQRLSPSSPLKIRSSCGPSEEAVSSITQYLKPVTPSPSANQIDNVSVCSSEIDDLYSLSDADNIMSSPSPETHQLSTSQNTVPQDDNPEGSQQELSAPSAIHPASSSMEEKNTSLVDLLPLQPNRPIEEVNVFAKRSVDDLQNIFSTWIVTQPDPLEEDLCMLADYLISILPTDLARVRLLLRILRRLIESEDETKPTSVVRRAWRRAFLRLRLTVDASCRRHYDADVLNLDFD